ncbi:MAG: transcriptional repressor LexA [Gammaproteobacteria bacterium]|nr:MAG: transcriptional repressor LexA [Gammaproteobacteria bacterium]
MTQDLTDRERETYQFIGDFHRRYGYTPKLKEIAENLGISSRGTVHRYLKALEAKGYIALTTGVARGIRLLDDTLRPGCLPLMGRIAAGLPIEAIPDQEYIDLSEFFVGPGRYVLHVQGDSMIEAGILDGDMAVIKQCDGAENGQIVVALVDNQEATLKRLTDNGDGTITLFPANRTMTPMRYTCDRVKVQGVLVGQFRGYA